MQLDLNEYVKLAVKTLRKASPVKDDFPYLKSLGIVAKNMKYESYNAMQKHFATFVKYEIENHEEYMARHDLNENFLFGIHVLGAKLKVKNPIELLMDIEQKSKYKSESMFIYNREMSKYEMEKFKEIYNSVEVDMTPDLNENVEYSYASMSTNGDNVTPPKELIEHDAEYTFKYDYFYKVEDQLVTHYLEKGKTQYHIVEEAFNDMKELSRYRETDGIVIAGVYVDNERKEVLFEFGA